MILGPMKGRPLQPKKRFQKCAAVLAVAFLVCALAACAPTGTPQQSTNASGAKTEENGISASSDSLESMGYSKFTDTDAGLVESDFYTERFINAGNRGCNACHEDLWEKVANLSPMLHLASTAPGYGRNAGYIDCAGCHGGEKNAGTVLRDNIHIAHMSNSVFVDDLAGNCFSCHALDAEGNLVMWEYFRNDKEFGGFLNAGLPLTQEWIADRDWPNDTTAGITMQTDMPLSDVVIDQQPTAQEDCYSAVNYDVWEVDAATWTLTVKGASQEKVFTYDDILALPATEMTVMQSCMGNGVGSYQVCNMPVKGVLLKDLIEACGGVSDSRQGLLMAGVDNWAIFGPETPFDLQNCLNNDAILVYEEYGEELSPLAGYPLKLVVPGSGAGWWMKWVTNLEFVDTPGVIVCDMLAPTPATEEEKVDQMVGESFIDSAKTRTTGFQVNSMWMTPVNDGDVLARNTDGTIDLSGIAYVWNELGSTIESLQFSADYGNTWTQIDIPQNLDFHQWVNWSAKWTPEEPGTYTLYMSAVDSRTGWQIFPSAITVVVE